MKFIFKLGHIQEMSDTFEKNGLKTLMFQRLRENRWTPICKSSKNVDNGLKNTNVPKMKRNTRFEANPRWQPPIQ